MRRKRINNSIDIFISKNIRKIMKYAHPSRSHLPLNIYLIIKLLKPPNILSTKIQKKDDLYLYEKFKIKRTKVRTITTFNIKLHICHKEYNITMPIPSRDTYPKLAIENEIFFSKDKSPKEKIGDKSKFPTLVNLKRLKSIRYGSQASHKNLPTGLIKALGNHERKIRIMHTHVYILITFPKR